VRIIVHTIVLLTNVIKEAVVVYNLYFNIFNIVIVFVLL